MDILEILFFSLLTLLALVVLNLLVPSLFYPIWNLLGKLQNLKAHDPTDWSKKRSSGHWHTGTYCSNCEAWTEHRDIMSHICHACGSSKGVRNYRSARRIWNGSRWVYQLKYSDTESKIVELT